MKFHQSPQLRSWHFVRDLAARQRRGAACTTFRAARIASASLLACVALAAGLVAAPAHAQTSWNFNGTGAGAGTWGSASSWTGGSVPTASTTVYLSSTNVTGDVDIVVGTTGILASGMVFQNTGATVIRSSVTTSRTGTIGAGGITMNAGVGNVWFGSATTSGSLITLSITANQTWLNNSTSGSLTQRGGITTTSGSVTLTIDGPGNTSVFGNITGITAGNQITIVKNGSGLFRLDGVNTFAGGLTLNSGSLLLGSNSAIGTGTFTIGNNGVSIDVTAARTTTNNNAQVWNGDFTFLGSNTFDMGSGAVTLGGSRTVTVQASTLTASGEIVDNGNAYGLTKTGTGLLVLAAANTYTGTTTVASGTLTIGSGAGNTGSIHASSPVVLTTDTSVLNFNRTDSYGGAVSNVISGSGSVRLQNGTLTLSGATSDYTGGSTIATAGAILEYGNVNALGTGTVTFGAAGATLRAGVGGTLQNSLAFTRSGTVSNNGLAQTLSGVVSGTGVVTIAGGGTTTLTAVNTYSGSTAIGAESRLAIAGAGQLNSGAYAGRIANDGVFEYGSSADQTLSGVISGSGALVKTGDGTLTLTGANTMTGGATLSSGTIRLGISGALGTGTITFNGGGLSANNATAGRTLANAVAFTSGSATIGSATDSGTLRFTGPIDLGGSTRTLSVLSTSTFSGAVSGAGGLTKDGAALLVLAGANTYVGPTTVSTGTLQIGDGATSGSIDASSNVSIASAAVLNFNRTDSYGGAVSNVISGAGSVRLQAGTLTLSGATSDYTGGSTIATGGAILEYGNVNALGTGTVTFGAAGATLRAGVGGTLANDVALANSGTISNGGLAQTLSGVVGGAGGVTIAGTGTTTLTASNTYAGSTTISAGSRLAIGGAGVLGGGTYAQAISNAGTFDYASSANQTVSGTISGAGSLIKSGAGTLTLTSANNSYAGGSTLSGGRTRIGSSFALGTGTLTFAGGGLSSNGATARTSSNAIVFTSGSVTLGDTTDSGALTLSGTMDLGASNRELNVLSGVTISGTIVDAGGGLTKTGAGTLTLSAPNQFTGGATLSSGTTRVGNDGAFGSGTITFNGGGLSSNGATARTLANAVAFTSGSATIGSATDSGTLRFTGPIDLGGSTRTINLLSTSTFSGAVSGAGGLTKDGAGNLVLSTANSYGGPTSVNAGTLTVGDASALGSDAAALNANGGTLSIGSGLDIVRTGPITVAGGTISGGTLTNNGSAIIAQSGSISSVLAGSQGLTKSGNGLLVLSNANTFVGPVVINGGTLQVRSAFNNGGVAGGLGAASSDPSNLVLDGGVLEYVGPQQNASDRGITIGENGGGFFYTANNNTNLIWLTGTIVMAGSGDRTLTMNNASVGIVNVTSGISDPSGGGKTSVAVVRNSVGVGGRGGLDLFGTLSFTGGLTVGGVGSSQPANVALRSGSGGTWTGLAGGVTINPGSVLFLETGTLTTTVANSGTIQIGPTNNTATDASLTGVISGTGSIVTTGNVSSRTYRLTGTANTYTGFTSITSQVGSGSATLFVTKLADYGQNSSIGAYASTGNSATDAANLRFGDTVATGTGATVFMRYTGNGDSTNRLFQVATSAAATAAPSTGGVSLQNDGSGNLNFTSTDAIPFVNGGNGYGVRLSLAGTWTGTNSFAPTWSDNGTDIESRASSLAVSGSGAWIVSGNNTFSGPTSLSGHSARLVLGSASALGTGTLTLSGGTAGIGGLASNLDLSGANALTNAVDLGANARIYGSNNLEFAGVVSSAASRMLLIANTATTTFSNANTYTGTTSVDAGVLVLNNSSALSTSNLRINNGVIGLTGSSGGDFTRALGTGNSQVQITGGGGFAAIDGNRSVNLGGSGATVTWGAGNFMTTPGGTFELGAAGGVGVLDFQNAMALGAAGNSRNIFVEKGASLIDAKLSGIISGNAGFSKLGTGVLELTGQNTYTGTTTVAAGKLLVNGTNSGGGRMIVEAGATLGGSGRIDGLVDVFGTLSPGNSPGLLTTGSLVLNASSTTLIDITGAVRGTEYDGIDLLNNDGLTYGGALSFDITSLFSESVTLDIFNFSGYTGGFSSVSATGAYGAFVFAPGDSPGIWEYTWNQDMPNETMIRFREATGDIEFAVVPEPGALAICGIGVAMAAWRLRRRRR